MPTIREVADKAGVSTATVSHVLNETRFVSEGTRERVRQAMEELGYRPNSIARSLRRGETKTLGLVLPDSGNPFFAEVGRAVETTAFELGYSVMLCNTEMDNEKEERYVEVLVKKQVDGLIIASAGEESGALGLLRESGVPVVVVDRETSDRDVDVVIVDNCAGGRLATQHLLSLGHERIACVSGPSTVTASADRVAGYREAVAAAGHGPEGEIVFQGDFHATSGYSLALDMLRGPHAPTAVFCCNDLMAIGVLKAAADCGLRIPEDLAVVGFDDIELATYAMPPLTTVSQPKARLGSEAAQMLAARIVDRNLPFRREVLPVELIVRRSSCRE